MNNQPPAHDPKNIWKDQKSENTSMSLEEIREKVRKMQYRNRLNLAIGLGVLVIFGWTILRATEPVMRAGFVLVFLGTLHMVINMARASSETLTRDAALTTSVHFYRTRLLRFRGIRQMWGRLGATLFFGGTLLLIGGVVVETMIHRPPLKNVLPFFGLIATWGVMFIILGRRQRRWLRDELERLDDLEKPRNGG